eukprot:TRINITY_DN3498_c0_g1_i12.p1 TRINITY_DN3498_c0_g1~~TRINITY_DN3498_c0_g1_i12.p1  ORF type:complete len:154 (-),score=12.42 TRINITY_DN3498_c0_g1_i12:61-522(-)
MVTSMGKREETSSAVSNSRMAFDLPSSSLSIAHTSTLLSHSASELVVLVILGDLEPAKGIDSLRLSTRVKRGLPALKSASSVIIFTFCSVEFHSTTLNGSSDASLVTYLYFRTASLVSTGKPLLPCFGVMTFCEFHTARFNSCLLYTSPSPRD